MKKMIVIREGGPPDSRELDDYLYNSEVSRSDFIDFNVVREQFSRKDNLSIHASEWNIVFKGDDKYDSWHFIADIGERYAFEDRRYKAMLLLEPYRKYCRLMVGSHASEVFTFLIYNVPKSLSQILSTQLQEIIESFDGEEYKVTLDEATLGDLVIPDT